MPQQLWSLYNTVILVNEELPVAAVLMRSSHYFSAFEDILNILI